MNFLMMLVNGSAKAVTETFTSNRTWTAPAGVTKIDTVLGKGAAGSPASTSTVTHYYHDEYAYDVYHHRDGTFTDTSNDKTLVSETEVASGSTPLPSSHQSQHFDTPDDPDTDWFYVQYVYFRSQTSTTETDPATTGASTTAFGKTFPGGAGGPATPASYSNVAVVPGQSYAMTIPSGGSITITYLK